MRTVAADVQAQWRVALEPERRAARTERDTAAARHDAARRRLGRARLAVEAEVLVARLAGAMARAERLAAQAGGAGMTEPPGGSAPEDRRVLPEVWDAEGRRLAAEARRGECEVAARREKVVAAWRPALGPHAEGSRKRRRSIEDNPERFARAVMTGFQAARFRERLERVEGSLRRLREAVLTMPLAARLARIRGLLPERGRRERAFW